MQPTESDGEVRVRAGGEKSLDKHQRQAHNPEIVKTDGKPPPVAETRMEKRTMERAKASLKAKAHAEMH